MNASVLVECEASRVSRRASTAVERSVRPRSRSAKRRLQRLSCSLNRRLGCASSLRMSLKFGSMAPQDRSGVVVVGMEVGVQDWEDEDADTNLLAIQIGGRKEGKKNMQQ